MDTYDPEYTSHLPPEIGAIVVATAHSPLPQAGASGSYFILSGEMPECGRHFLGRGWHDHWNGSCDHIWMLDEDTQEVAQFKAPPGYRAVFDALVASLPKIEPFIRFQILANYPDLVLPEQINDDLLLSLNNHLGGRYRGNILQGFGEIKAEASASHGRLKLYAELQAAPWDKLA